MGVRILQTNQENENLEDENELTNESLQDTQEAVQDEKSYEAPEQESEE